MNPICLGVKEAAAAMSVSTKTIRDWIQGGELAVVKLPSTKYRGERGKRILILASDLQAFAERHRVEAL